MSIITQHDYIKTYTIQTTDDGAELTGIPFTSAQSAHNTLMEISKGKFHANALDGYGMAAKLVKAGYAVPNPDRELDSSHIYAATHVLTGKGFRWAIQLAAKLNVDAYGIKQAQATAARLRAEVEAPNTRAVEAVVQVEAPAVAPVVEADAAPSELAVEVAAIIAKHTAILTGEVKNATFKAWPLISDTHRRLDRCAEPLVVARVRDLIAAAQQLHARALEAGLEKDSLFSKDVGMLPFQTRELIERLPAE